MMHVFLLRWSPVWFGLFIIGFCQPAYAQLSFPSPSQLTVHKPKLAGPMSMLSLPEPSLGTHRWKQRAEAFAFAGTLGTLQQGFVSISTETVVLAILLGYVLPSMSMLPTIIGGSIALSTGRGRMGWGIAGIVVGSIGLAGSIALFFAGIIPGAILLPFALASLIIGIVNVALHRRVRRRREFYGMKFQLTPWVNAGANQSLQSGLALTGQF